MAKYVGLGSWSDQGVHNAKDTVNRGKQAPAAFSELGVQLDTIVWALGRYDTVAIVAALDDKLVTAAILQLGGAGNVQSERLRAFAADDMGGVFQRLAYSRWPDYAHGFWVGAEVEPGPNDGGFAGL